MKLNWQPSFIHQGKDLLTLINDILDLSKVEAGKLDVIFEATNISDMASKYASKTSYISPHKKNVEFTVEDSDTIPDLFYTDAKRIEQIIKNLLSNAFKFTEKRIRLFTFRFNRNKQLES